MKMDFTNFHSKTMAIFTPQTPPDREPDFVSMSGSVYWDVEIGVVRASDHWAGHLGCTGQADCIWRIRAPEPAPGEYLSGICAYGDFRPRKRVPVLHHLTQEDRELAARLLADGALEPPPLSRVPPWASVYPRFSSHLPSRLRQALRGRPDLHHALGAPDRTLDAIASGAEEIPLHYILEIPDSGFWMDPVEEVDFPAYREESHMCETPTG